MAIFIIIGLGVGFFAGLRACRPALTETVNQYFETQNFYDFRCVSSIGFSKDSVAAFSDNEHILNVEGALYEDALISIDGNDMTVRLHSAANSVNTPYLVSGRLPETENECVVDADCFDEDIIGKTIILSDENSDETASGFNRESFLVVGRVTTPLYISADRGTTSVGDGKIAAFIFIDEACFTAEYYKELYVSLGDKGAAYSDEYDKWIAEEKDSVTKLANQEAQRRYKQILSEIEASFADYGMAQKAADSVAEPIVFVMTREDNAGYASFEQDSCIIENISVVFPAFFFLVAALVCVTTMTRMIDEQRTQIGVFKAMGYGKWKICSKYLFYAGSAGLAGSIFGFFIGTILIPKIFWNAYTTVYNFADVLLYSFEPSMYIVSLLISLLCTAGVTILCCRNVLREAPASILRPKTPKNGKRILIERFKIWRKVSFLHKVSIRNVIRYKQRFFLMILGISGCTALLLTGFGIRDSIQNVTAYQYDEIILYDAEIAFTENLTKKQQEDFRDKHEGIESMLFLSTCNVDIVTDDRTKNVNVAAVSNGELTQFMNLHNQNKEIFYPQDGEIILCKGIAEKMNIKSGQTIMLSGAADSQVSVKVSGIFDNYIGNYIFVSENTIMQLCDEEPAGTAYVRFNKGAENIVKLQGDALVSHLVMNQDTQETIDNSFSSLNLVVLLIIICAGILAFIVLFNLININIGERIREIATIKVLGFFNHESAAYVFREVNMLTAAGALSGLLLGWFLHAFVMEQIKPDGICFDSRIMWYSYLLSIVITFAFALLVQIVMRRKLKKISMTQSLKSVE
ncbi:MAG: FtsX-like permease family protein [Clostridium sp.]|nr:FtsX-like permease family protein [Clostridium sp.]